MIGITVAAIHPYIPGQPVTILVDERHRLEAERPIPELAGYGRQIVENDPG